MGFSSLAQRRRGYSPLAVGTGGVAGNGLLNNLIAYWPGNEASGNALDLHTNALHLTDVNAVTSNTGLVYPLARQYVRALGQRHTRPSDDTLLSAGNNDLTIATWFNSDPASTTGLGIFSKYGADRANREYWAFRLTSAPSTMGLNVRTVEGVTYLCQSDVTVLNSQWYLFIVTIDSVNKKLGVTINDTTKTTDYAGTVNDGIEPFIFGAWSTSTFWGRIGPTMFWKSAPGGGGVLTVEQRIALYNDGAGLPYASFTS